MPHSADPRPLLRRARLRYRRPIAAALAAAALLLGLASLRPASPQPAPASEPSAPAIRAGDVLVPVPIATGAGSVAAGMEVDLVSVDDSGTARIVAARARVAEPASGSGAMTGSMLLMSMTPADALAVTEAVANGPLALVIHAR